eukprot:jgi/Tetstr1/435156/TSEL_002613.t1
MVVEGNGGGGEGIPLPVVVRYAGGGRVGRGGAEVRQAGGRGIRAPRAGDELAEGVSEETVSALGGEEQREGMLALERRLAVAVELEECELSYDAVPELVAALHRAVAADGAALQEAVSVGHLPAQRESACECADEVPILIQIN